jgi:TPR repeat protein
LWYRRAAEQGDHEAQYRLGLCYSKGEGLTLDPAQAAEWLTKAAEGGHEWAQYRLGECYQTGVGVEQDLAKAVQFYRMGADQGLAFAQYKLGECYCRGIGTKRDLVEGYAYTLLAVKEIPRLNSFHTLLATALTAEEVKSGQLRSRQIQSEISAKKAGK